MMRSKIDPKVRAIYLLFLDDKLFITDPSANDGKGIRYLYTRDAEAAEEIYRSTESLLDTFSEVAESIIGKL